jgi:cell division protein FtsL
MKKLVIFLSTCFVGISVFLFVLNVFTANNTIDYGKKLSELDQRVAKLTNENETLSQEVASASALITIDQKARELGFVEKTNKNTIILSDETYQFALQLR